MSAPSEIGRWLETYAERSSDGFLLVSGSGVVEYSNAAARAILAAGAQAIAGSPVSQWFPELELRGDRPVSAVETTALTSAQDPLPAEVSATPIGDGGRFWVVLRDITLRRGLEGSVRRHAEELEALVSARTKELDECRERSRTMYDLAPVLDFNLDSQGSIASANRKACLSLGVSIDRLVGLPLADLAEPSARQALLAHLDKAREGSLAPFETKLRSGDGSSIDVAFHACRGEARSSVRLVGVDVTARREAERLVDQSLDLAEAQRARMERILRGIGEGVVVTDPDGQVRLMNAVAERFLGIEERYAFGRDLFSEQRDVEFVEEWQSFLSGSEDVMARELDTGGPPPASFALTISRIRTPEGRPAGAVAVIRDVTEERRVERMKRDFVSNITHELRTPLASIRGFTTTILRGDGVDEGDARRFLGIVEKEAERLQHIIEDLLVLSSLEAGRETLNFRRSRFTDLLEDAKQMFASGAAERGVTLEVRAEGGRGEGVYDPDKMRRVLDNLIGNALKYTPRGGRVDVELGQSDDRLECSVRDTGKGMPPDVLEHVFDRHYSAHATPGNPWGTGLGLHIAQRLVELHGGEITASSRPGEGSEFRFRIPAVPKATEPKRGPKPARPVEDPLVDDPDPVPPSALSRRADWP